MNGSKKVVVNLQIPPKPAIPPQPHLNRSSAVARPIPAVVQVPQAAPALSHSYQGNRSPMRPAGQPLSHSSTGQPPIGLGNRGGPIAQGAMHQRIGLPAPNAVVEEAKQRSPVPSEVPAVDPSAQDAYVIPKDNIKCVVCLDIYDVLLCGGCCGALVCEGCKARLPACPLCRSKSPHFERQSFLDHIMNNTEVACRCGAKMARRDIQAHKKVCPVERIECPSVKCKGYGLMEEAQFMQHFSIYHKEEFMLSLVRKYATQCPT